MPNKNYFNIPNLIAIVTGSSSVFALSFGAPGPYYLWLFINIFCIAYLSNKNIVLGICSMILLNPFMFLIRNADANSIVLAGARTEWMFTIIFFWFMKKFFKKIPFQKGIDLNLLFIFLLYSSTLIFFSQNLFSGLMGARFLIMPALIYFIVRDVLDKQPNSAHLILNSSLIAIGIMSLLSIFWYYTNFEVKVLDSGSILPGGAGRTVFGIFFERLNSLIGGGPSNIGIYLSSGCIICLGLLQHPEISRLKKLFLLLLTFLCAYGSLISVSRSSIILIIISLFSLLLSGIIPKKLKIIFIFFITFLIVSVGFGTYFHDISLFENIKKSLFIWQRAMPMNLEEWIFGSGLDADGGTLLVQGYNQYSMIVDGGWPQILKMTGLIGTISIMSFLSYILVVYYRLVLLHKKFFNKFYVCSITAGSAAIGLMGGSVHSAVIFRPVVDILFYTLTAIMISIYSNRKRLIFSNT